MNRLLLLLTFLALGFVGKAQNFQSNYLAEDFLLYKGVLFKINDYESTDIMYSFYSDLKHCQSKYGDNVLYPNPKYSFNTLVDSLRNKIFKVLDVVDKTGTSITKPLSFYLEKPIFILEDMATKQKIYYKYDFQYEHSFPFSTTQIPLDEDSICSELEREIDDFTNEIKFSTPYPNRKSQAVTVLYKHIKNSKTSYYLSLHVRGQTVVVNGVGATILFTDGTKWSKNLKISVDADSDGYDYNAFIPLNQADLTILATKKMKKFRLDIFDEDVNIYQADKINYYIKCLKKAK